MNSDNLVSELQIKCKEIYRRSNPPWNIDTDDIQETTDMQPEECSEDELLNINQETAEMKKDEAVPEEVLQQNT